MRFIRSLLPDLLAAGWTRRELFRVGKGPELWGVAWHWREHWGDAPIEHVFDQSSGAIEWYVHENNRTSKMVYYPRAKHPAYGGQKDAKSCCNQQKDTSAAADAS
jgi:hypothetical protein